MAKILSSIVAENLTYAAEKYKLLPASQFGGRPAQTTTDALHTLTNTIQTAWRHSQVVAVLFLDIEGAFPNAVHDRLIHNLQKQGVPTAIVDFIEQMLRERRTKLRFCHSAWKTPVPKKTKGSLLV
jgi:hypothetical protein